jgi:hypothetical protein
MNFLAHIVKVRILNFSENSYLCYQNTGQMDFPLHDLLDEQKCYEKLIDLLHNGDLLSPYSCSKNYVINDSRRSPVITYKDKKTGGYFTIYTATIFEWTHFKCSEVILIIRGFQQGVSTAQLSRELGRDYQNLLELRHKFMACGFYNLNRSALSDKVTETDEMFQNAGEKGDKHLNLEDPPRRRANKKKGMARMQMTDHP